MNKRKLKALALAASLAFLGVPSYEGKQVSNYEIIEESKNKAFARYRRGLVYIGNEKFLSKVKVNENDILVLDCRNAPDPNMKIISSYLISDDRDRREILEILLKYEEKYPSAWNRTLSSMLVEWYVHNLMHFWGYELDRTTDVDLSNADEVVYYDVLKKIIIK